MSTVRETDFFRGTANLAIEKFLRVAKSAGLEELKQRSSSSVALAYFGYQVW